MENVYDGAGRTTATISLKYGDETKRTTTQHSGDRTTVIPPKGGTATTTITDALGRKTERRSYTDPARTKFQATTYAYDKHGSLAKMTDAAGTSWTWTYDARGRQVKADDPDKGLAATVYDAADRPVKTADARGITLTTSYDALGRKKDLNQGTTQRAAWTYDSVAKGLAASDTRYVDGKAYTTKINGYNDRGQPTSSTTTLPASEGALAGDYTWTFGYNQYTGAQTWAKHPAIGNLPSERVTTNFNNQDLPSRTTAGRVPLVGNVDYDVFARSIRTEYGAFGQKVYRTTNYDEHTGALTRNTIDGDNALRVEDTRYTYDAAGNTTRISSTSGQDQAAVTDTQCFATDALRRMTDAWTTKSATDDCTSGPSSSTVGGPDSYWHSYTYDVAGNRTKEIQHATGGLSTTATRTYTTGKAGDTNPHALRSVATTGGPDNGKTETFTYDETGNTTERTGGARNQKMTWDSEGNLATVTEDGKTTEYLYDSDGNRMLARNADGTTTAYLPSGNELKSTASGAKTATRYYTHGGETVAIRNSDGFTFLFSDHQGTGMIAVAMGAVQTVTRRKQLPFGGPRSATGTNWPGDRGFVGGTTDPTGLTHLGAREYDPALGRFISVDPLLDVDDAHSPNGYTYANNSPVTMMDPDGLAAAPSHCVTQQCASVSIEGQKRKKAPPPPSQGACATIQCAKSSGYQPPGSSGYGHCATVQCAYSNGYQPPVETRRKLDNDRRRIDRERAEQWRQDQRAAAEARQKQNKQKEGFWKGVWEGTKETFGTWDGWKNRVLPAVGFGACLVVSAGACIVVGVVSATVTYGVDWARTGNFDGGGYVRTLAWTVGGGLVAGGAARAMGASGWRNAFTGNAVERATVRVPAYRTKMGHGTGPGGGRKGWATQSANVVDPSRTMLNVGVNSQLSWGFCGAGGASALVGRGC
ncbi:RHS repeat-associated core domain-containing protein [Streptomyces sp. NPDC090029]|uniref:RHS repeat-associated core domain-containing protein n=1 Tax=Streptomyces sp. NPDC090029 TaxID=3365924 RepID=UPI003814DB31